MKAGRLSILNPFENLNKNTRSDGGVSEDFTTKILNWKIEKESAPISAIRQIILLENKSFSFFQVLEEMDFD